MTKSKQYKKNSWKRQIISVAEDFGYPKEYIRQLEESKTEDEASGIMRKARHAILG